MRGLPVRREAFFVQAAVTNRGHNSTMTHLRAALILSALCFVATPVLAEDPPKADTDPSVQLANIGIPVFTGRIVSNYIFVSIKIHLNAGAPEAKFRDKEPYFRDAAIHTASKTSFADPKHSDQLDAPRFQAAMMTAFAQITGPGMIKSIEIVTQSAEHPAR